MKRQADLLEVVLALGAARRFADLLHGRDQEPDQDGDDRNDDQQLDQRESSAASGAERAWAAGLKHDERPPIKLYSLVPITRSGIFRCSAVRPPSVTGA